MAFGEERDERKDVKNGCGQDKEKQDRGVMLRGEKLGSRVAAMEQPISSLNGGTVRLYAFHKLVFTIEDPYF